MFCWNLTLSLSSFIQYWGTGYLILWMLERRTENMCFSLECFVKSSLASTSMGCVFMRSCQADTTHDTFFVKIDTEAKVFPFWKKESERERESQRERVRERESERDPDSTWIGDRLGTPGAVGFLQNSSLFFIFFSFFLSVCLSG